MSAVPGDIERGQTRLQVESFGDRAQKQLRISPDTPVDFSDAVERQGVRAVVGQTAPHAEVREADGLFDSLVAGFQRSVSGLKIREETPDVVLPEDAGRFEKIMSTAATLVGDIPTYVVGGLGGGLAGSLAGPTGTVVGAGAGGEALTQGTRRWLLDEYRRGRTKQDTVDRLLATSIAAAKGGLIGGVTAGVGNKALRFARSPAPVPGQLPGTGPVATTGVSRVQSRVGQQALAAGVEVPTLVGTASALERELPSVDDFIDAGFALGGLRIATGVGQRVGDARRARVQETRQAAEKVFVGEGKTPAQKLDEAAQNPREAQRLTDQVISDEFPPLPDQPPANATSPLSPAARRVVAPDDVTPEIRAQANNPFQGIAEERGPQHIRLDLLDTTQGAKELADLISRTAQEEILTAQRGRVPIQQTLDEAVGWIQRVGGDDALKGLDATAPDQAAQVIARKQILQAALDDVWKKAQRVHGRADEAPAAEIADFTLAMERARVAQASFRGKTAELGRGLRALREQVSDPRVRQDQDSILKSIDKTIGRDEARALADLVATAEDGAAVRAALEAPTKFERFVLAWKAGMLSAPNTMQITTLGNIAAALYRVPEKFVGAGISKLRSVTPEAAVPRRLRDVSGEPGQGFWSAAAFPIAMGKGSIEALAGAAKAVRANVGERGFRAGLAKSLRTIPVARKLDLIPENRRASVEALARSQAKSEGLVEGSAEFNTRFDQIIGEQAQQIITGRPFLDGIIRLPFTVASLGDAHSVSMLQKGTLVEAAVRQATSENLTPLSRQWDARVRELSNNPTKRVQAEAQKAAERASFREQGKMTDVLNTIIRAFPIVEPFALPFRTAAVAAPREFIRRTPFAPLIESWRQDFVAGGAARDDALAELFGGMIVGVGAFTLARSGVLTGGPHPDDKQRAADREAGKLDYALKLKDGTQIQLKRWEPAGSVLGMAADFAQAWDLMEKGEREEAAWAMAWAGREIFLNKTWLLNVSSLFGAIMDPERHSEEAVSNLASPVVPNIVAYSAREMDPFLRAQDDILARLQARIPVLREQLRPTRTGLGGEPVPATERLFPGSPSITRELRDDPVVLEAQRLGVAMPRTPKKKSVASIAGESIEVELTDQERDEFDRISGEIALEVMQDNVGSPTWQRVPDLVKMQIFRRVFTSARKIAASRVLSQEKAEKAIRVFEAEAQAKGLLDPEG